MRKSIHALDRRIAIAGLYETGQQSGVCTAENLGSRLGASSRSVGRALQMLAFDKGPRRPKRYCRCGVMFPADQPRVRYCASCLPLNPKDRPKKRGRKPKKQYHPREWQPPAEWPADFQMQRRLRKLGLSADLVMKAHDAAADELDILEQALGELVSKDVPPTKRGELKGQIKEVIREERKAYKALKTTEIAKEDICAVLGESVYVENEDLLSRLRDVADIKEALTQALRESSWMPAEALLERTRGLVRAAVKKGNTF